MRFVYVHIVLFAVWMIFIEKNPWPMLTLAVSLEAIFLSTFVMISQNRADAKRQVIADQQWRTVQEEDKQNEELLSLSRQILQLTKEVRAYGDAMQSEGEKSRQALLDISRQTLTLTKDLHARAAAGGSVTTQT